MSGSLPPAYFEGVYQAKTDPWEFATSPYEARKYAVTLACLPHEHYARAVELGCSIGVLTAQLADRCQALLALDVVESALARARARCADLPHVRFERRALPENYPAGSFDLVLLSEVGYYFSPEDLSRLFTHITQSTLPGAHLMRFTSLRLSPTTRRPATPCMNVLPRKLSHAGARSWPIVTSASVSTAGSASSSLSLLVRPAHACSIGSRYPHRPQRC